MAFGDGSVVLLQNSVTRGSSMRMSSKTCREEARKKRNTNLNEVQKSRKLKSGIIDRYIPVHPSLQPVLHTYRRPQLGCQLVIVFNNFYVRYKFAI